MLLQVFLTSRHVFPSSLGRLVILNSPSHLSFVMDSTPVGSMLASKPQGRTLRFMLGSFWRKHSFHDCYLYPLGQLCSDFLKRVSSMCGVKLGHCEDKQSARLNTSPDRGWQLLPLV